MAWSRRAGKKLDVDGQLLIELRQDGVVVVRSIGGLLHRKYLSDYLGEERGRMKVTAVF